MYSRMKRKCSFIVLVVMVVSLLMVSGMPVQADSYSWMESAKKVKINSTIKGVAEEYVYNSGNDMCEILALQEFSTLEDLKKFPYLRELCLNECIVDDNTALGELTELENLKLDEYSIDSLDRLKNLTALKSLIIQGAEFEDLQALKELTNMEELRLPNNDIKNIDALEKMTNLEELILYGNQIYYYVWFCNVVY